MGAPGTFAQYFPTASLISVIGPGRVGLCCTAHIEPTGEASEIQCLPVNRTIGATLTAPKRRGLTEKWENVPAENDLDLLQRQRSEFRT